MRTRRGFLFTIIAGFVAMAFVVGSVIADELLGVLTKVDVEGKTITVLAKDTEKEVVVKITDDTKAVQKKKGEDEPSLVKVDLEKLETKFKKYDDQGKKISLKVTHEKGVASKIEYQFKKKKAE
jgi:LytS/YehU family sensor histidine kinase